MGNNVGTFRPTSGGENFDIYSYVGAVERSGWLPKNPTPVSYVVVANNTRNPITINPGTSRLMDIAGGYEYYDCSTFGWMTYLENATMYGYKAGGSVTPTYSDPITVLVRDDSTIQASMLSLDDE